MMILENKRIVVISSLILLVSISFFGSGCDKESDIEKEEAALKAYLDQNNITTEPKYSGLYYIETLTGSGATADGGDKVRVKYVGTFLDGEEFDSGVHTFTLGIGQVIRGWDEGISYMKEGGKATLIIPSSLAYGVYGHGDIPGYTPLLFKVELLDVY